VGKIIIGFIIGTVLGAALFLGPLRPIITLGEESPEQSAPATGTVVSVDTDVYTSGNVKQILAEVRQQIQRDDIRRYYDTLMGSYDLKDGALTSELMLDEESVLSILPDILNISQNAMTLPLVEAGKEIKDPEIAKFYADYLQSTGLADGSQ